MVTCFAHTTPHAEQPHNCCWNHAMRVYAVDPGSAFSAIVALDMSERLPAITMAEKWANKDLLDFLWQHENDGSVLVLEEVCGMGMAVGQEVFDTVFWTGRFVEAWEGRWDRVTRNEVKVNLCGSARANDANVRKALIDRWGGPEAAQRATKGSKKKPAKQAGPLGTLAEDTWSSLAVGLTWRDQQLTRKARDKYAIVRA